MARDDNAEFELSESFGIDNGELDDLDGPNCFVLGVEWAQIRALVQKFLDGEIDTFQKPVHSTNCERIEGMLENHKVPHVVSWLNDDWVHLHVERVCDES